MIMEIVKFVKIKNNKYKVIMNDKQEYLLYDDLIVAYNLLANKNIDQKLLTKIMQENEYLEAYYKGLKYLTTRLRTKKELTKLLQKDFEPKIITETIYRLQKEGYLNEVKYLRAYINDQIYLTLNGPYKILRNLENLGLDLDLINQELNQIGNHLWQERINKIITKKLKLKAHLPAYMVKQKLSNELYQLGYDKEMSDKILGPIKLSNPEHLVQQAGNKIWLKYQNKYEQNKLIAITAQKLYQKGFTYEEIENFITSKKETNN